MEGMIKMTLKKISALVAALVVTAFSLLAAPAFAAETEVYFGLARIADTSASDSGSGWNWVIGTPNVLTLDGTSNIDTILIIAQSGAAFLAQNVTINVTGDVTIDNSTPYHPGINQGAITYAAGGVLTINIDAGKTLTLNSTGQDALLARTDGDAPGSIFIIGNGTLIATTSVGGTYDGPFAAIEAYGIVAIAGDVTVNATATATGGTANANAVGILGAASVIIADNAKVTASGTNSHNGGAAGIGSGGLTGNIEISGNAQVSAIGNSPNESAGIATINEGVFPGGSIMIENNANVSAAGLGGHGDGLRAEGAGSGINVRDAAIVEAAATGSGYSFNAANAVNLDSSNATVAHADGGNYVSVGDVLNDTGTGSFLTSPNSPTPTPTGGGSSGGCDAGFGAFGLFIALGALALRGKSA